MTVVVIMIALAVIVRVAMIMRVAVMRVIVLVSNMIVMIVLVGRMIVMGVVVMPMIVMTIPAAGIGAAFRIERRVDGDDARAEALHHLLDHMIAPDAQALADDLCRQVPIAEMPGDPHQMIRIAAANLDKRLRRGDHFDEAAVFQHQRIAAAQRDGFLQVEQEFQPASADHRHAAAMPVIEIEHHRIGGMRPISRRADLRGADHSVQTFPIAPTTIIGLRHSPA